jgi:FO synthase
MPTPGLALSSAPAREGRVAEVLVALSHGETPDEAIAVALLGARGVDVGAVAEAADELRSRSVGETVRFVVNRNINYTNICFHSCAFCALPEQSRARGCQRHQKSSRGH